MNEMKKIFALLLSGLFYFTVAAQTEGTIIKIIAGKVINEMTNEPVSYTNVGLENTLIGTASNAEGYFQLKIPKEMVDRNIYFSAVGFKNDTFPVSQLFGREYSVIKLSPKSYDIENIDVAGQSRVLQRILRMANENTPYNFIGGPFNLVCDLKSTKTINDTVNLVQNADVLIYDKTGYSSPSKLDAYRWRNYSVNKQESTAPDYSFAGSITHLDDLLELDLVRTASSVLDPAILSRFDLKIKTETEVDGSPVWIIAFKEPTPTLGGSCDFYATLYEGEIVIAKDDYSVKKITGKARAPIGNRQGKSLAVGTPGKNHYKNIAYDFTVSYSNLKPDYFLLNRTYETGGDKVSEQLNLVVKQVQTTNLTDVSNRDYFPAE